MPKSRVMTTVRVFVTLKPALLDSEGRTVAGSLQSLGYDEVSDTRIGKMIELKVDNYSESRIKEMCDRLLANPVIEEYRFEVVA
jgi:phosphoribosylformylglycinamidine synthase subunit PurS